MVGVILSLNRWVRLVTNPLAARLYERFPAGALIVVAIVLSAVSTAMYALPAALAVFLLGRLLWGFCYSLLRLGSFLFALEDAASHAGRRIGNTRAVWGIGYFAGAVFAPFATLLIGWTGACVVAAALTLVAGIGPACLAASWRRSVRVPEEGHVPASVWEPRLMALFVTLPLVVHLGVTAARVTVGGGPVVAGAAVLLGLAMLGSVVVAIALGEIPVNVADRSSDGYELAAIGALLGGRSLVAAGGCVSVLVAGALGVRAVRYARWPGA